MRCASCSRELPSGFPGGTVTCACGVSTTLDAASIGERPSGGPYRAPSTLPGDELESPCPFCGNGCPPLVRVCPHCDVRLDNVRCDRCYTLQQPGSFACARCGQALELEPVLDATDAPCPRCMTPLEAASAWEGSGPAAPDRLDDPRVHECPRCGGMFVPREALADILARAEVNGPFRALPRAALKALDQVKYVPCPLCHTQMNRVNFGKVSGVIVDVCRGHGTWFDGGELTRVVSFAAGGGLTRTRAREQQEKQESAKQSAAVHAEFAVMHGRDRAEQRVEEWRSFLNELFFWS